MKKEKKDTQKHSFIEIAGEKAEALKEGLIAGKDKIVSVVEEKFESAKKAIHDFTTHKPAKAKKPAAKKAVKKAEKKAVKKVAAKVKKAAPKKSPVKAVKKVVKKAAKKVAKKAAKKSTRKR
jgi:hypothetical protein